jgi:DNA-binding MarR family transcriptional regulator
VYIHGEREFGKWQNEMRDQTGAILERYRTVVLACAVMNLRQVTRSVTNRFDEQLRPVGLRATQLNLLMAIETSTAATVTELAEILAMDRTTMTRNLKLLRDRRLVESKKIALTEKGRRAAAAALPLWEKAQAEILGSLGTKRWEALLGELEAVKASIQP